MLALVTNADESRGSKALILVCLCVCLYDRTKTAETTITKLATGIVHHKSWLPITHLILSQKVKVTESQCAKHISGDRVAGVSLH